MALTTKQIYDLNNMNVAAQNVQLGTLLNEQITEGGGTKIYMQTTEPDDWKDGDLWFKEV